MPIEPATAFQLFDKALAIVGLIREQKKRRDDKTDEALKCLHAALAETKMYLLELKDGAPRDVHRQFRIAGLWNNASIPLRHIDLAFAERCQIKGSYWQAVNEWDEAALEGFGIKVYQMAESTRQLLAS